MPYSARFSLAWFEIFAQIPIGYKRVKITVFCGRIDKNVLFCKPFVTLVTYLSFLLCLRGFGLCPGPVDFIL